MSGLYLFSVVQSLLRCSYSPLFSSLYIVLRCTPRCAAIFALLKPSFSSASIFILSALVSWWLPFLFAIVSASLSLWSIYDEKPQTLLQVCGSYFIAHLQHFLQAVYFFFAWLIGMPFGFFIPEQLGLLWYFLLLRSIYTIVSPAVR